jgi:hypothetical protein
VGGIGVLNVDAGGGLGDGVDGAGGAAWKLRAQIIKRARVIKRCFWILEIYQKLIQI